MPAQRQGAKSAIEAHHVVTPHRTPDRDCRRPRLLGLCDVPETTEGSMYLGNEPGELIDADPVTPHVAADNARDEARIDRPYQGAFFHRLPPQNRATLCMLRASFLKRARRGLVKTSKRFLEYGFMRL
jgi:hypothetical protein